MLVYTILLIYIFISSILYKSNRYKSNRYSNKNKEKIIYLIITFIPLLIVMGFRGDTVGTDTYVYSNLNFKDISRMNIKEAVEQYPPIWAILNKIFLIFGTKSFCYIFPLSAITLFFVAKFIYDYSEDIVLSTILFILTYMYFNAFNGARQFLSIAIIINSFKYLIDENKKNKKGNILKFLMLNIIAIGIHPISAIYVIMLLTMCKPTKSNFIKISIILIVFFASFLPISQIFVKRFPHYELYLNEEGFTEYGFGKGKNRSFAMTLIYILFEFVFLYLILDKKIQRENLKIHFVYSCINLIAIIIGIMSLKSTMFVRIAWYFTIFNIIYVPYILKYFKGKQKIYMSFSYCMIMIIPYYIQLQSNINGILPYKFNF